MNLKNKWFLFIVVVLILLMSGCSFVYYNPFTSGGEGYDKNVIKVVIDWLKYYIETKDIEGIEGLVYPYSPHYDTLQGYFETLFASCSDISWDYEITDISFQQNGEALVMGRDLLVCDNKDKRSEFYITMKQGNNGVWYIYDIQWIVPY